MKLLYRAVGVVNLTSTGSMILTLTNGSGVLSRSRWNTVFSLTDNIQNIGWYNNNLTDIPDDPSAVLQQGEIVKATITLTGSNQYVGGSLEVLPTMIVQFRDKIVAFPAGNAISQMAEYLSILLTENL